MGKFIDLTTQIFGRLKVLKYIGEGNWLCGCSCSENNRIIVGGRFLRDGRTKSCGCLRKEMLSEQSKVLLRKRWEPIEIDKHTYGIPLSMDQVALIDKEDFDKIKDYGWYAHFDKVGKTFYAITRTHGTNIIMHRLILNAPDSLVIDHADHNGLNNRKSNIRVCSQSQNCMNKKVQSNNTSGYRGVSFHKTKNKYQATIMVNRKQVYLGTFNTALEASEAYQIAAKKLFGKFYYNV
jgi:hypothetical protein